MVKSDPADGGGRKQQIADAFGRAARSYDDAAAPQRQAAALVADLAAQQRLPERPRILEVGCGTGILTRHIRAHWPDADLVASDLSPDMVGQAARGAMIAGTFLSMDGEVPPFDGPWFDLILSSLAFQWFSDLPTAIERLAGLLRPGGSLFFSTMGADSFAEWRAAHAAVGESAGTPDYPDLAALRSMLATFPDAFAFDEHWDHDFGGAKGFLAHLKGIGATVPTGDHAVLTPARLRSVMTAFNTTGGTVTYHILFGRVTRIAA
ncbi:methyltransferase domain-containing protein [Sphingobium sufflavum]|uniref:methyltransferase domain-containing protein n=1 Tax=Sphingobium sufflavum TaxID=1129547 RepID=UPI001F18460C|nr:methyltransferase domain-containing protein [Sphingobium sufflavum]MCE7795026.1 methyltransferase domain-containing protein [Sphingobium sufflavum]